MGVYVTESKLYNFTSPKYLWKMFDMKYNSALLESIVSKTIRKYINEAITHKTEYTIPQGMNPTTLARMIASKENVSPNDFVVKGSKLIYAPKKKTSKPALSKPENMSIEDYYKKIVLPNNEKIREKENQYPDEEWRPVKNIGRYFNGDVDYSAYYEVSNHGRLRIINFQNAYKSNIYTGYDAPTRNAMQFHLNDMGKGGTNMNTCPDVKYIVADAWLEPHDPKLYKVIHIDGDYHNNNADNLKWVPRKKQ